MKHASVHQFAEGISIIIPTYGKHNCLQKVLETLIGQDTNDLRVEVLIIYQLRNDVHRIVASLPKTNISFKPIKYNKTGATGARNLGTINAQFKLLVYLDDDMIPSGRHWLQTIWQSYKRYAFKVACGIIYLDPPFPSTLKKYRELYAYFHQGGHASYLKLGSLVPSGQLIVEKTLMMDIGGFRKDLDRVGINLLSGGDNELTKTFGQFGIQIYYSPKLRVIHHILPYRVKKSYLHRRLFWQGVTDILVARYCNELSGEVYWRTLLSWFETACRLIIQYMRRGNYVEYHHNEFYYATGKLIGFRKIFLLKKIEPRPLSITEQI